MLKNDLHIFMSSALLLKNVHTYGRAQFSKRTFRIEKAELVFHGKLKLARIISQNYLLRDTMYALTEDAKSIEVYARSMYSHNITPYVCVFA